MTFSPGAWIWSGTALVLMMLGSGDARAADSLITWRGEVRVRAEADGRDFIASTPSNTYALLRSRLGADIRPGQDLLISLAVQDSRVFGQPAATGPANLTTSSRNLDLHEAFVRIDNLLTQRLSLTAGRMGLTYGSERILGRYDWSNVDRVFDGLLVRYEPDRHQIDFLATLVTSYAVPPSTVTRASVASKGDNGYQFWGGTYTYTGLAGHTLHAAGFHERSYADTTTGEVERSRWTLSGGVKGEFSGPFYEAEGAYQLGSESGMDISAFMLVGVAGYRFGSLLESVQVGYEHLSGTSEGSSEVRTFVPPFPDPHRYWGILDYYTDIRLQTFDRGLRDLYLSLSLVPMENLSLVLAGHHFLLAEEYVGRTQLGQEIDLICSLAYNRYVTFELGGGLFLPDEIMKFAFAGEDNGWWGYFTIHARFD